MCKKSMTDINNLAIQEIEIDLLTAFHLFRDNAEKNGSFLSWANYGNFLIEFGSDISEVIAQPYKVAEHYLRLAQKQNPCFGIYFSLGEVYLKEKKYRKAVHWFQNALAIRQSYILYNNIAIAYYNMKQYKSAYESFSKAAFYCDKPEELVNIYEALAFTAVWRGDLLKAQQHFLFLKNLNHYEVTPDSAALSFLCKDYAYILENYMELLNDWVPDFVTLSLIAQTIHATKSEDCLNQFIKYLQDPERTMVNDDVVDENLLLKITKHGCRIKNIEYFPKHIFVCGLIGCKKHGSDYNIFSL